MSDTATATPQHVERTSRRNIAAANGEGNATFLDYGDTRPINPIAAALQGAAGGAATSAMGVGTAGLLISELNDRSLSLSSFSPQEKWIGAGIVAASTLIGAVINVARANTHNKWASEIREQAAANQGTVQRG